MADLSDVEQAVVSLIASAIYPNGTSYPSAIVLNGKSLNCRVSAGWPLPGQLDPDMIAGTPPGSSPIINVTVFAQPGLERNTTRFPRDWHTPFKTKPTMTATVSGSTVTLGGTPTPAHFVTLHANGIAMSYAATATDTLATVAAALAAQGAPLGAIASGATIQFPATSANSLKARLGTPSTSVREIARTNQRFLVTIWAPNDAARVATSQVVDPLMALTDFVPLPFGYTGELKRETGSDVDRTGKQSLMCRDLYYWIEYPILQTTTTYTLTTFVSKYEVDTILSLPITPLPLKSFTPARIVIT